MRGGLNISSVWLKKNLAVFLGEQPCWDCCHTAQIQFEVFLCPNPHLASLYSWCSQINTSQVQLPENPVLVRQCPSPLRRKQNSLLLNRQNSNSGNIIKKINTGSESWTVKRTMLAGRWEKASYMVSDERTTKWQGKRISFKEGKEYSLSYLQILKAKNSKKELF